jgi:hypothetical protein
MDFLSSLPKGFFRRSKGLSFKYGGDGLHTLLNGVPRRDPITLAWKCSRDLLNLGLQHLVETQLILYCYCDAINLTIHTL